MKAYITSLMIGVLFSGGVAQAQKKEMSIQSSSKIEVNGTSTLHDWSEEVTEVRGKLVVNDNEGIIEGVSLSFTIPVESLKSGNSTMDGNTYKALESKDHPNITFNSTNVMVTPSGASYKIEARGTLNIAGGSNQITLVSLAEKNGDTWECHGSKKIKMTDYDVDPPTAMFGTVKTGDDLNITYQINFK